MHYRIENGGIIPIEKPDVPGFVEAEERANNLALQVQAPGFEILHKLQVEVVDMSIASRFSPERIVSDELGMVQPGANEQDHKRNQLQRDIEHTRQELALVAGRIQQLVMDIEATKTE